MKIDSLYIENFKSIESAQIKEIDNAFILVGKNNTGKSSVIDAVRAVLGEYTIRRDNFRDNTRDVVIRMTLSEELDASDHVLIRQVTYVVTPDGRYYYEDEDGMSEKMPEYLPRLYYIDHRRNLREFQSALLDLQGDASITMLKEKKCPYQNDKTCDECFQCIPEIEKKTGAELTVFETAKLMEYRMYKMNLDKFSDSVNKYLKKNGMVGYQIRYEVDLDIDSMLNFDTVVYQRDREVKGTLSMMGAGSKSIYLLSLLEAYVEENSQDGGIIMIEDPEIFLHPQLQKTASEILYRLSKKNQIIFSTYSPNMIFNFSSLNSPKSTIVPSSSFSIFILYFASTDAERPINVNIGANTTPTTPTVIGIFIIIFPFFSITIRITLLFLRSSVISSLILSESFPNTSSKVFLFLFSFSVEFSCSKIIASITSPSLFIRASLTSA